MIDVTNVKTIYTAEEAGEICGVSSSRILQICRESRQKTGPTIGQMHGWLWLLTDVEVAVIKNRRRRWKQEQS